MIIGDDNPLRRIQRPWVTWGLMVLCVAVFAVQQAQPDEGLGFALHAEALRATPSDPRALLQLLTYIFMHSGWLHLAGNLLVLFAMGDNVEDAFGHVRFALVVVACGIAGGAAHVLMTPNPELPLVGASGAIAGVMGAYLLLYPRAKLYVLAFGRWPTLVPASWFVAVWIISNLIHAAVTPDAEVAWWAHIGGFVMGLLLVAVARPAGVALLQPAMASPAPAWPWFQRVAFDFAPEIGRRDSSGAPREASPDDGAAAAGKAAVFILLAFFSAW